MAVDGLILCEFQIGAHTYRARRMDAFTQRDVLARITPVLANGIGEIIPLLGELQDQAKTNGVGSIDLGAVSKSKAFAVIGPFAEAINGMSDKDRQFITNACLDLCERRGEGQGWAKIWNAQTGRAMFDDINYDLSIVLKIITEVLKAAFTPFFSAMFSNLTGEPQT